MKMLGRTKLFLLLFLIAVHHAQARSTLILSMNTEPRPAKFGIFDATADWGMPESPPQIGFFKIPGDVQIQQTQSGLVYDVYGNGDHVFVDQDEGFFLYAQRSGSWTLTAQVQYLDKGGNSQWPVAGIMIREKAKQTDAKLFSIVYQAGKKNVMGDSIGVLWRTGDGAIALGYELITGEPIRLDRLGEPVFLRVTRDAIGNYFWAEWSYEGENWNFGHGVHLEMRESVAYGLDVANGVDNTQLAHIRYSHVSLEPTIPYVRRHIQRGGYSPNIRIPILLEINNPTDREQTIRIEEYPPEDWEVSHISHSGTLQDHVLVWEFPLSPGFTSVRYFIRPMSGEPHENRFRGTVNASPIQGDDVFIPTFLSISKVMTRSTIQNLLIILCATMFVFHFCLFLFYPQIRENLYFSVFLFFSLLTVYVEKCVLYSTSPHQTMFYFNLFYMNLLLVTIPLLLFFNHLAYGKPSFPFWFFVGMSGFLILFGLPLLHFHIIPIIFLFCFIVMLECLRVIIDGVIKRRKGILFIAVGAVLTLFLHGWGALYDLLYISYLPIDFYSFECKFFPYTKQPLLSPGLVNT